MLAHLCYLCKVIQVLTVNGEISASDLSEDQKCILDEVDALSASQQQKCSTCLRETNIQQFLM
jgi:hypothetical protein